MSSNENKGYIKLGIYEKGDVIVGDANSDIILDCTYDLALIRKINGESVGRLANCLDVYSALDVDFDHATINDVWAWKEILDNKLLEGDVNYQCSLLKWIIGLEFRIKTEVLDYIRSRFPNEDMTGYIFEAKRLNTAKWIYEQDKRLEFKGYEHNFRGWLDMHNLNWYEYNKMYEYFFGENGVAKDQCPL